MDESTLLRDQISRRALLRGSVTAAALAATSGLLGACSDASRPTAQPEPAPARGPVRGGRLRVTISGTSSVAETFDPHLGDSWADGARIKNVFDKLAAYNKDLTTTNRLAEMFEPNADGTAWRIRLRSGVTFHDGKPVTADDVLYSVARMKDPKNALPAASDMAVVDLRNSKRIDDLTVELACTQPISDMPSIWSGYYVYVIQDGTKDFSKPIGSGPFKFESFTPGDRAVLTRNENYWEEGRPYLDGVEIITLNEADARLNALLGREVDVAHEIAPAQAKAQQDTLRVVQSPLGFFHTFTMQVDKAPLQDNNVRLALKHAVDRQQMVDTVHFGYGEIGNDLYGKGAPFYNDELPQREYDPERSRAFLAKAGLRELEVTLHTSDPSPGLLEAATLFAEHAKAGGIRMKLDKSPRDSYYQEVYRKVPFAQTTWGSYALDWFYAQTLLSDSHHNETNWRRPDFDRRFAEVRATMDPELKRRRYFTLQEELYNEGGHITHSYAKWLDALGPKVRGIEGTSVSSNDWCSYRNAWIDA